MKSQEPPVTASPCIGVCELDRQGVCAGCYRTRGEIGCWLQTTELQKKEINARAKQRRQASGK